MSITRKAVTKLCLCFLMAFSILGATITWLINPNNMAKAVETVAMDDKINVTYSEDFGGVEVDFDGFTVEGNSWHDAEDFSANNGVNRRLKSGTHLRLNPFRGQRSMLLQYPNIQPICQRYSSLPKKLPSFVKCNR